MKICLLFLLIGCVEKPRVLSADERQHLGSLLLDQRIIMNDCLGLYPHMSYAMCLNQNLANYIEKTKGNRPIVQSGGASILKTAAGVAVGMGAAKLLFGGKR